VHNRTAEWFWDQEVFDFLADRLHLIREASMRHYVAAWEPKQAGLDWRSLVLSRCLSGSALLVAQLKADPRYVSEAERVQAFIAKGGGSRSTYFNLSESCNRQRRRPRSASIIPRPPERPPTKPSSGCSADGTAVSERINLVPNR